MIYTWVVQQVTSYAPQVIRNLYTAAEYEHISGVAEQRIGFPKQHREVRYGWNAKSYWNLSMCASIFPV